MHRLITWDGPGGTMFRTGKIPGAQGWWTFMPAWAHLFSPDEQKRVALLGGERWTDPAEHGRVQPVLSFTEIGPEDFDTPHQPDVWYQYRGYMLYGEATGGWTVHLPLDEQRPDRGEVGWGVNMYEAMAVVNESEEGCARRKSG